MCIGYPMQVVASDALVAICNDGQQLHSVDMSLIGEQPKGTWLLVFLGTAREILSSENAKNIFDALTAVNMVMQGGTDIDHLFADLSNREPQLPSHLKPFTGESQT